MMNINKKQIIANQPKTQTHTHKYCERAEETHTLFPPERSLPCHTTRLSLLTAPFWPKKTQQNFVLVLKL